MRTDNVTLSRIKPYPGNPRTIPEAAVRKVAASLKEFGWRQPIVVDAAGVIIVGHTRFLAAHLNGLEEAPVHVAEDLTPEQVAAYRIADNRLGEETAWDDGALRAEISRMASAAVASTGFNPAEIDKLLAKARADVAAMLAADDQAETDESAQPITEPGDVWQLGRHRLRCGDCTDVAGVAELLAGAKVTCLLTDPPYCSGGFQEAGRGAGSVGTDAEHEKIANDTLSSRGYMALIKQTLQAWNASAVYMFTDWRMWCNLFEAAEGSGYGVRQLLVWDKGTPGMGMGWRAQHELVLFGTKLSGSMFDSQRECHGNVITCKRTGNKHHTTEKPLELMTTILSVTFWADIVGEPFAGSGTTILACEHLGRTCYASELKPHYCDTAIRRWQSVSGGGAVHVRTGKTFDQIAAERGLTQPPAETTAKRRGKRKAGSDV
jgi:DNA modification methylase